MVGKKLTKVAQNVGKMLRKTSALFCPNVSSMLAQPYSNISSKLAQHRADFGDSEPTSALARQIDAGYLTNFETFANHR